MCKNIIFIFMHGSNICFVWKIYLTFSLFMKNEKLWRYDVLFCKFELMKLSV